MDSTAPECWFSAGSYPHSTPVSLGKRGKFEVLFLSPHLFLSFGRPLQPLGSQAPVAVQSLSRVPLFVTPRTAARQAPLFTISWNFLSCMFIELVILYNHLILCCPFLLLHSIFPSIRVFSNKSVLHIRWPE